jgi:hypothetical protein
MWKSGWDDVAPAYKARRLSDRFTLVNEYQWILSHLYPPYIHFKLTARSLRTFDDDDRSIRMGRIRLPERISDGYPATSKE